jgi:hypothetical protein
MSKKLLENLDELSNFLISIIPYDGENHDHVRSIIEQYYAIAISLNNINAIALLNIFVRENNIIINKLKILEQMYNYRCCVEYSRIHAVGGTRVEFKPYSTDIENMYIQKYWNMFEN